MNHDEKKTERIRKLSAALLLIQTSDGEPCERCGESGRLWADGKAHNPNYMGMSRACPQCDGKGVIFPDFREIATNALLEAEIFPLCDHGLRLEEPCAQCNAEMRAIDSLMEGS